MRRLLEILVLGLLFLALLSPASVVGQETREQRIHAFAASCLHESGGALIHPDANRSTISSTFAIASVLDELEAWTAVDLLLPEWDITANMTSWVQELQDDTEAVNNSNYGGFVAYEGAETATLTDTYYAIQTLFLLNQTTSIDSTITVDFTSSLQLLNATMYPDTVGSFTDYVNATATLAATYYALETLETLDQINHIDTTRAITWVSSCQVLNSLDTLNFGGFTNGRNTTIADLQSTYMAIRSLEILNALNDMNQNVAIEFILSCYRTDSNYPDYKYGFGPTPDGTVSTLLASYYAVAALKILNAEDQLSAENVTTWVVSKQMIDGGFADITNDKGFAPQTHFAIGTLILLDQRAVLNEPAGPEPYIFPWLIIAAVVIVIIIVIVVFYGRRQEWF